MTFTRAPRVSKPASSYVTMGLVRALIDDERFQSLDVGRRLVLLIAASGYTDATGRFWCKMSTLARRAGVGRQTAVRATSSAVATGLLTRAAYLRPDGTQGASAYCFDPVLLASDDKVNHQTPTLSPDRDKVNHGDSADKVNHDTQRQGESRSTHRRAF